MKSVNDTFITDTLLPAEERTLTFKSEQELLAALQRINRVAAGKIIGQLKREDIVMGCVRSNCAAPHVNIHINVVNPKPPGTG